MSGLILVNIEHTPYLKDFLINTPPNFKISNKCCEYSKKKVLHQALKDFSSLEFQATKVHLEYLEKKYDIAIQRYKSNIPIPLSAIKYGQPFLSKRISEYISRLQKHNFNWEDDKFETLTTKYPNCESALRWWCNAHGENSRLI